MHAPAIKPWYRQFWPWFIIALPASAVIAGLFTLGLAIRYQDPIVVDDYYKEGLSINQQVDKQQAAATLGIQALARYSAENQQLSLQALSPGFAKDELLISLNHPTLAGRDQVLRVQPAEDGNYYARIKEPSGGRWHIAVEPTSGKWRLTGRMSLTENNQLLLGAAR